MGSDGCVFLLPSVAIKVYNNPQPLVPLLVRGLERRLGTVLQSHAKWLHPNGCLDDERHCHTASIKKDSVKGASSSGNGNGGGGSRSQNALSSAAPRTLASGSLAFDTESKPVRLRYVIYERVAGRPLRQVSKQLNGQQRLQLAEALGSLFAGIHAPETDAEAAGWVESAQGHELQPQQHQPAAGWDVRSRDAGGCAAACSLVSEDSVRHLTDQILRGAVYHDRDSNLWSSEAGFIEAGTSQDRVADKDKVIAANGASGYGQLTRRRLQGPAAFALG